MKIIKGQKISNSRLTPVAISKGYGPYKSIIYECVCECGNHTKVPGPDLASGNTRSCGCLHVEQLVERSTVHGFSKTPEYLAASAAFQRCRHKNDVCYENYGGRGIKFKFASVAEMTGWLIKHMPKPAGMWLDRIDNDGHYEQSNLKWSTPKESCANRRCTRKLTIAGQTKPLTEWAEECGMSVQGFASRVKRGTPQDLVLYKGKISKLVLAIREFDHEDNKAEAERQNGDNRD